MKIRLNLSVCAAFLLTASLAYAQTGIGPITLQVPNARRKAGTPATIVAPRFDLKSVVVGTDPLENPSGVITNFGLLSTGTLTEPDENTYLQFANNPGGPTPGYDYGRNFVFQGHENSGNLAYVTRVNLDVTDPAHRITLLTPVDTNGVTNFNSIDGSTYDPFTNTLLFAQEAGTTGGVIEISTTWPPTVNTLYGILGRGGYEGIHPDDQGNIFIVEDVGGTSVSIAPGTDRPKVAKQPNSFVYRFVPTDPTNLSAGGILQALRVTINSTPVTFNASDPVGDTYSQAQLDLHTPGTSYPVDWVTIHDTAVNGTAPFSANAAAKAAGATPFKRPENMQFLPGSGFLTFFFCPTGDTDSRAGYTPALAARGTWGSIFRVDLDPSRNTGMISLFFLGDPFHAAFDNLTFSDDHTLLATEDRGDLLHTQLNRLDSVWAFATDGSAAPRRFIALGRDQASVNAGEDNEPTGLHVSVGGTSAVDLPGTLNNLVNPRAFVTRQHGDNQLWEIVKHK